MNVDTLVTPTANAHIFISAIDSRVSSILGHNAAGNVFGIGKNKRSYMMFDLTVNKWVSVPKSMFNPPVNQFVKLEVSHVSGVPASNKIIGLDHWGGRKIALFFKAKIWL